MSTPNPMFAGFSTEGFFDFPLGQAPAAAMAELIMEHTGPHIHFVPEDLFGLGGGYFLLHHPMQGTLDSRSLDEDAKAALAVLIVVDSFITEQVGRFNEEQAAYNKAMSKYSRASAFGKLIKSINKEEAPDSARLSELDDSISTLKSAFSWLSIFVFSLDAGLIDASIFDDVMERLRLEELIGKPLPKVMNDPLNSSDAAVDSDESS